MGTTTRMFRLGVFAATLGLAGCGGDPGQQVVEDKNKTATPAPSSTAPAVVSENPQSVSKPPAPPPANPWEMDPSRHVVPETRIAGKIANDAFQPDVLLVGDTISFQATKGNDAQVDVGIKLSPKLMAAVASGMKIVVRPDTPASADVPEVTVTIPSQPNPVQYVYPNGYALTLDLGKKVKGHVNGKVYLALQDDHQSYFAGTFETDWQRSREMPPTADDMPFVTGQVTITGATDPTVRVGSIGLKTDGVLAVDNVESKLAGAGGWSRLGVSALFEFQGEKAKGRYEHTRLAPGRYCLFATVVGGPAAWKWLTVEPGTQVTHDFTIDVGVSGSAEVALPADFAEKVYLCPADGKDGKTDRGTAATIGLSLGLSQDPKAGKVAFEKLAPGTYDVWALEKLGTIEVKRGETAKLDAAMKK